MKSHSADKGKTHSGPPKLTIRAPQEEDLPKVNVSKKPIERIADTNDGTMLSTSEILDFSAAVDSSPSERGEQ